MKTTLDLDDALLIEAKTVAAKRRTTLKAIVESALRQALGAPPVVKAEAPTPAQAPTLVDSFAAPADAGKKVKVVLKTNSKPD